MPSFSWKIGLLLGFALAALFGCWLIEPFPQPLWYHDFADQRVLLGLPNIWNVVSNLPFVLAGLAGMRFLMRTRGRVGFEHVNERWSYLVFFAAIALTGIGSAYYHWEPNNPRLLWDRMPLAVAFMALFGIVIGERIGRQAGNGLFIPLILLGAGSVIYWHWTEQRGEGDLRFYLLVQLFPLAAVPLMLLLFPSRYSGTGDLVAALAAYGLAKALEFLDRTIYSQGQIISGHTLKHCVAGLCAFFILHMLRTRKAGNRKVEAEASIP